MSVEELATLVGFPVSREFIVPWADIEFELGAVLPQDYKEIIEHFGPGEFSPFLTLLVPGVASPALELRHNLSRLQNSLEMLAPANPIAPYAVFPALRGIIPWAVSGTGEIYYWETSQSSGDYWSVVVRESRGPLSFRFSGGSEAFLLSLFRNELSIPFIPNMNESDYAAEILSFHPGDGSWLRAGALPVVSHFHNS